MSCHVHVARAPRGRLAALAALALAVLLAGFPRVAEAQQQGPVTLRLKGKQGQKNVYKYETNLEQQLPPQMGGKQTMKITMVVSQELEGTSGDTLHYSTTLDTLDMSLPQMEAGAAPDISQYQGQSFDVWVTGRGNVVEMPDSAQDPIAASISRSMRQLGFPALPNGPVKVGQSWTDTTHMDAGSLGLQVAGEVTAISHTTLSKLSKDAGATIADLDVHSSYRFQQDTTQAAMMNIDVSGTRATTVRFDVTNGRLYSSSGSQNYTVTISGAGLQNPANITGTGTSTAVLRNP